MPPESSSTVSTARAQHLSHRSSMTPPPVGVGAGLCAPRFRPRTVAGSDSHGAIPHRVLLVAALSLWPESVPMVATKCLPRAWVEGAVRGKCVGAVTGTSRSGVYDGRLTEGRTYPAGWRLR